MTYQVLARKWRPKSFAHLKGQWHVTRALSNAIITGKLHHAYLFTGTRGVGKTTIARILAKCLNCSQGITNEPCGKCSACVAIDAGRFIDLIEVDAASRTRVEDTRELLENVQYAPSEGRFKIYLIDEVHMLSGHSFNALLKTLEEPPPHVKFILATTDPERIPITVLSRCLRFNLSALSTNDIVAQLEEILLADKISFDPKALVYIARAASGSMRDALSVLEQTVAFCGEGLHSLAVEEMLGLSYQQHLPALVMAIAELNAQRCLQVIEQIALLGADFEQILASILQVFHAITIAQVVPHAALAQFAEMDEVLLALKDKLLPEEVQLFYQIALMGQKDMRYAPSPRIGFEMTLLRMIAFAPASLDKEMIFSEVKPKIGQQALIETQGSQESQESKKSQGYQEPQGSPPSQGSRELNPSQEVVDWAKIVTKLSLTGLSRVLVQHCVVTKWDSGNNALALTLDVSQKDCFNLSRQAQIQEALQQYFGRAIKLSMSIGEVQGPTPMMQHQEKLKEQEIIVQTAVQEDKAMQSVISTFGASIEKITAREEQE